MATITIDQKRCKACGYCTAFCPCSVYEKGFDDKPLIKNLEKCVACQLCVKRCPDFAIMVEE